MTSRSKSFFSVANFRPYMVFDGWCFIEYSVKKVLSFVRYLLFCIDWFARFCSGNFDFKAAPRSGNLIEVDDYKIKAMLENNPRSTIQEIAEKLNISHTCVERHLKQLGYVNKLDIWVPHELNELKLTKRISICDSMLKRNETDPFLKRIITGDEKWLVYDNVVRKRSWSKRDEAA